MLHELLNALEETLFMVFSAGLLAWIVGLPLGILLYTTRAGKLLENSLIYTSLRFVIGTTRSIPYAAFSIALIPFTQNIAGSHDGSLAALIPLTLIGIPHFAYLCDKALQKVPTALIEATQTLGATTFQIITKVLIPESLANLVQAFGITLVHLISYSTIAGVLGGGGLGHLLTHKGYGHFQLDYVLSVLALLIVLVQVVQRCTQYVAQGSVEGTAVS